ncbi:MAG TPA: sigma 54-interacting transcriptional regulator [Polyangiaceae bacterium]|nr:sigma 54-interacting transcriptional regulator [Polyangiaceae bacterium]
MGSDATTLRLDDTVTGVGAASLWMLWAGLGAAPPLALDGRRMVLGRAADADVRLEFPGVSRLHAEIRRAGPLLEVRDLGSTNGSFLNGQRLTQSALSAGDVLRLGDAVGVVFPCLDELAPPRVETMPSGVLFGPGMSELRQLVRKIAPGTLPVMLEGATGVGKEGVARLLHHDSGRTGTLQAVNCGALPPALAEAELFGYRKGAFTGAEQAALGHVRAASGGTLFLDELYDLAPAVQAKLLRVIQEQQVVPLGETRPIPVDLRLIAASPIPIRELVASGRLREDLAARLSGVVLTVPKLSERRVDIPLLFSHFLDKYSGGRAPAVDGRLLEHLLLQAWPGNVRELELLARRLLALHGAEPVLRRSHLGAEPSRAPSQPPASQKRADPSQDTDDLRRLRAAFAVHGNLSRAAREAGISRQRAYRLLGERTPAELLEGESYGPRSEQAGEAGPVLQSED